MSFITLNDLSHSVVETTYYLSAALTASLALVWIGWNVGIAAKQYTGMLIDHTGMASSPGEVAVCFLPVTRSTGMAYRFIPSHYEHWNWIVFDFLTYRIEP